MLRILNPIATCTDVELSVCARGVCSVCISDEQLEWFYFKVKDNGVCVV